MKKTILFSNFILALTLLFSLTAFGQTPLAEDIEIQDPDGELYNGGTLYVKVKGKKRKVSTVANDAWIVNGGKEVVFSYNDRTRGFEGEGETLFLYEVKTGKKRKIMEEYTFTTGLSEVRLSNGALAYVVSMGDGGLGGSYIAVVDPRRGEVWTQDLAELIEIKGDQITLAYYKEEDWEAINQERGVGEFKKSQTAVAEPTKVKPAKTETFDLKEILKNKVIINKTNEELGREYEKKYSNLTVYQWRPNEKILDGKEYFLMGFSKEVPKTISPLRTALAILFAETTKAEKEDGWESPAFGMKFEGVVLRDGVATIKFSQPKEKKKMLSFAGKMFVEAVEKTAKQFATVKKVEICEVGGTNAFENTPQISRCRN